VYPEQFLMSLIIFRNHYVFNQAKVVEMKIVFFLIVILHALIHLPGFLKGFEIKEIKELTSQISMPLGIVWLAGFLLFLAFGILFLVNFQKCWMVGFIATLISQILVMLFWSEASYGSLPNILIFAVSLVSYGDFNFDRVNRQEISNILDQNRMAEDRIINEGDIQYLPEPVRHWLHNSGIVGHEFINIGHVTQKADVRMKPEQKKWMKAVATQYTTLNSPAFIWSIKLRMNQLLFVRGRDKFVRGKGEMMIKLNSLINIVNEHGAKIDEGALQRYLGEMVWFPSMALSPYISWQEVDSLTATASIAYEGTSGSGTFYFNSNGDVVKYFAMRYRENGADAKRYGWEIRIMDYKAFEGIMVPVKMTSTWKLDEGDWNWLNLEVTDIKYNRNAIYNSK